jgi:hypothetical protein
MRTFLMLVGLLMLTGCVGGSIVTVNMGAGCKVERAADAQGQAQGAQTVTIAGAMAAVFGGASEVSCAADDVPSP